MNNKQAQSQNVKPFEGYFFAMCTLSIVYTAFSSVALANKQQVVDPDVYDMEELHGILFELIADIIFKGWLDIQATIYFIITGSFSFFYLYIVVKCIRLFRHTIIELSIMPQKNLLLLYIYIISSISSIIVSIKWMLRTKKYFYDQMCLASNNNISSSTTYYSIYYTLEGCTLLIINQSILNIFFYIYMYNYTSQGDLINNIITAIASCACWCFLWIDKHNTQKKWFIYGFISINLFRFISIYITSGERRYILNTYYRYITVSERFNTLINLSLPGSSHIRHIGYNVIDNLEILFVDVLFNFYFVRYCILLYKSQGRDLRTTRLKARMPIQEEPDNSSEEV
ncbi:hypothetical protein NEIRO03_1667 [Nematocida sp. AWRm78]|nr:hypothetical protein NEIRO02_1721 [Nematocida sp. AWRm79]KAI5184213.1 hypothetical protein NEIRO03_1667 [Nematocida sp. AWRm78]